METPTRTNALSASEGSITSDRALTRVASGAHDAIDKVAGAADEAIRSAKPALEFVLS